MPDQLDLFSASTRSANTTATDAVVRSSIDLANLDDMALIAALQNVGSRDGVLVAQEIGHRGLSAAIPALEHFCRLYAAYGVGGVSREQEAALNALAMIGGTEATATVIRLIERGQVQGTTLKKAVNFAADKGGVLPINLVEAFLQDDDPAVRRDACRLARRCAPWHRGRGERCRRAGASAMSDPEAACRVTGVLIRNCRTGIVGGSNS